MTAHMLPHMLPTPRRKLFALFPTKAPLALPATSALAVLILLASLLLSVPVPCRGVGGSNAPQLSSRADPSLFRPHAGKAVHVQGRLFPVELDDHEFHFVRSGVRLERYVESFQWEHDGRGGYRKDWFPYLIDSRDHTPGHLNPLAMPFENHTQVSLPIRIAGAAGLALSRELNGLIDFSEKAQVDTEDLKRLPDELKGTFKVSEGYFLRGRDMRFPSVGDVRVSFFIVKDQDVSILARLDPTGTRLMPCEGRASLSDEERGGGIDSGQEGLGWLGGESKRGGAVVLQGLHGAGAVQSAWRRWYGNEGRERLRGALRAGGGVLFLACTALWLLRWGTAKTSGGGQRLRRRD